jgi:hypothetical protein
MQAAIGRLFSRGEQHFPRFLLCWKCRKDSKICCVWALRACSFLGDFCCPGPADGLHQTAFDSRVQNTTFLLLHGQAFFAAAQRRRVITVGHGLGLAGAGASGMPRRR